MRYIIGAIDDELEIGDTDTLSSEMYNYSDVLSQIHSGLIPANLDKDSKILKIADGKVSERFHDGRRVFLEDLVKIDRKWLTGYLLSHDSDVLRLGVGSKENYLWYCGRIYPLKKCDSVFWVLTSPRSTQISVRTNVAVQYFDVIYNSVAHDISADKFKRWVLLQ